MNKLLYVVAAVLFFARPLVASQPAPQDPPQLKCQIVMWEGIFDRNIISELSGTRAAPITTLVTVYPRQVTVNDNRSVDHASQVKLSNGLYAVIKASSEPATVYNGVNYRAMTNVLLSIYDADPSVAGTTGLHRQPDALYTVLSKTDADPTYVYFQGEAILEKTSSKNGPLPNEKIASFGAVCSSN